MKLGYINYLNCFPFYYHMFHVEPVQGVDIVPAYPSELNAMLKAGALDMSPISSAAYAEVPLQLQLNPDFCLSSVGYVRSVILISKKPIENLDGSTIGLSRASQTSAVLLKILLQKYYGLSPNYTGSDPYAALHGLDAKLIIGNEAMMHEEEPLPYVYDLGDLWLQKTNYPVVFAVFAVRQDAVAANKEKIDSVCTSYRLSLDQLAHSPDALIAGAQRRYPAIAYDIAKYYSLLKFEFTQQLKDALLFYFSSAYELGLLPRVSSLQLYER